MARPENWIGVRVPRREDFELLTGRAQTVADLQVDGSVELAFVRSACAHGTLRGVDLGAAREVRGVIGAWAAPDLIGLPDTPGSDSPRPWPALARGEVRYYGQAIAAVAADSRAHAEDGVRAASVSIDRRPVVVDPVDSVEVGNEGETGAPLDDVFATAPVVIEATYLQPRMIPTPMEGRAILVRPDGADGLTVWVSHQAPHRLRGAIAGAFGLAETSVRVIVPATGGAFGSKSQTYPEYIVAVHLARLLGRPVRWIEDRREALTCSSRGRGQQQQIRLAADGDGRLLGYELVILGAVGAYPHTGASLPVGSAGMASGAYRTPRVHGVARSMLTNQPPTSAYRGAGRPEAAYAIERSMELLSRRLGIDPAELRRRNFIRPDEFPYETPTGRVYDSGNYAATLEVALAAADYDGWRIEQQRRREAGEKPVGIGIATYIERAGGPPQGNEFGSVEVCSDGTVIARTGSQTTGQAHQTAFAQIVSTALDVPMEQIRVVQGDTGDVPDGTGTFGSRSIQVGGGALWSASRSLIEEACRRAVRVFGLEGQSPTYAGAEIDVGGRKVTLAEVVAATGPLRVDERWSPPHAFPYGAYVIVVEVDPELGDITILKLVAVDDHGIIVNPMLVEGQGHGSIVQGLGQALFEEELVDADGIPLCITLLDYLLPAAGDIPELELRKTHTANPNQPFGAKGAGEAGCIGVPPALVNAVCDALDIDHIDMPLTAANVWLALQAKRVSADRGERPLA